MPSERPPTDPKIYSQTQTSALHLNLSRKPHVLRAALERHASLIAQSPAVPPDVARALEILCPGTSFLHPSLLSSPGMPMSKAELEEYAEEARREDAAIKESFRDHPFAALLSKRPPATDDASAVRAPLLHASVSGSVDAHQHHHQQQQQRRTSEDPPRGRPSRGSTPAGEEAGGGGRTPCRYWDGTPQSCQVRSK